MVFSLFLGTNRIYIFGNIYWGVYHENHCIWVLATSYCVSTEYVELAGFHHRHDWVRNMLKYKTRRQIPGIYTIE